MQIKQAKNKKKYIKHQADYIVNHFGFDFFDVEKKIFNKDLTVEEEKKRLSKAYKKYFDSIKTKKNPFGMFFYKKPISKIKKNKKNINAAIGLDIINLDTAIGEAVILKSVVSLLKDEGYTEPLVVLNAIGGKSSQQAWRLELSKYYRENKNALKTLEQRKITTDPMSIFFCDKEYLKELNDNAPSPIEFLSDKNIEHFQNVISYLEHFEISYLVDKKISSDDLFFSKTIFRILAKNPKTKKVEEVAFGGRYDNAASKIYKKRKISAIGLTLHFFKKNKKQIKLIESKLNLHLVKISNSAKLKFLDVVDDLGKLHIPVSYDITEDKISKQLHNVSKEDDVDHIIIIGEKEAKQNKVLVRTIKTAAQISIPMKDTAKYIKTLSKK